MKKLKLSLHIEEILKANHEMFIPEIHYFNGTQKFSTLDVKYASESFDESIRLWILDSKTFNRISLNVN